MRSKILLFLLVLHIFFMFYHLESWAGFGWDQVDNAWAAIKIITLHKYPLVGMVAKQNTGIYIGPLYYYLVTLFYLITRLDPIASPVIAGVTSLFSFFVLYVVSKKLFNERVALLSCFIYTFSSFIISTERVQWPVNFIAPLSLLILYFLHNILLGQSKYFIHLAVAVGLSFHIHFTAIFYPVIILAALPFIRWNRGAIRYFLTAIPVAFVFFVPQIIYYLHNTHPFTSYFQTSYHGLHLRRVIQLVPDAFIKFQSILMTPYAFVRHISFLFVPIFLLVYRKKLSYLILLWFLIPWVVFATYSGEISDYYFSLQSYIAIIILAYLSLRLPKLLVGAFWIYWAITNAQTFFRTADGNMLRDRASALEASKTAKIIPFTEGNAESYFYYYYMYNKGGWLPYQL